jgi:hypothetical protein
MAIPCNCCSAAKWTCITYIILPFRGGCQTARGRAQLELRLPAAAVSLWRPGEGGRLKAPSISSASLPPGLLAVRSSCI